MPTAKWSTPGSLVADFSAAALNSLADTGSSGFFYYDNLTNKDIYALVIVDLASLTPSSTGAITLHRFTSANNAGTPVDPDNSAARGGGEKYTENLTTGTGAKRVIFEVLLKPFRNCFAVTNSAGVALASSGNTVRIQTFGEDIS